MITTSGTLAGAGEMAFAYTKMTQAPNTVIVNGTTYYDTYYIDGTLVELIQRSNLIDPVSGDPFPDHIALIKIVKQYSNP